MLTLTNTFNNSISVFYYNMGSYSIRKDINNEDYKKLSSDLEDISFRIKNSNNQDAPSESFIDALLDVKIGNENIQYIIQNKSSHENLLFGFEYMKKIKELLNLLVTFYLEKRISYNDYEEYLSDIQHELNKLDSFFNKNILSEDYDKLYPEDEEFGDKQAEYYNQRINEIENGNFEGTRKVNLN
ncbi:MAG: hypothetical protein BZ137_06100 [Methanosphaera sp. rholeuAM130]|nr:hypothetical protein [Methanosphaera sp.]RAP53709.1 MAG: hypothetical protein BZ137_06100 [Methanosphaera sp. rholeuAM130]